MSHADPGEKEKRGFPTRARDPQGPARTPAYAGVRSLSYLQKSKHTGPTVNTVEPYICKKPVYKAIAKIWSSVIRH